MTRYIVTWVESAQDELAQIRIDASDRDAVTTATHAIDKELVEDAATKGSELREGLRELTVPPLSASCSSCAKKIAWWRFPRCATSPLLPPRHGEMARGR